MFRFVCPCCQTTFLISGGLEGWHCPETGQPIRFPELFPPENRLSDVDWLAWSAPEQIMPYLRHKASKRKLRLLYCAFCRQIWDGLPAKHRQAVEIAERFADGLASQVKLMEAFHNSGFRERIRPSRCVVRRPEEIEMSPAIQYVRRALRPEDTWFAFSDRLTSSEQKLRCYAIRDIFGQLHWDVKIEPSWLRWNQGVVAKLGQVICKEGRFEDLPILADALGEAGCTDSAILNHCRQPGEHVRGCWVVDLIDGNKVAKWR